MGMRDKKSAILQILTRRESILFIVLILAVQSLFGWLLDEPAFTSFSPDYIPIAPATALMFLILCMVFFSDIYFGKYPFAKFYAKSLTVLTVLICLEIFLERVFSFPWDIENVFIRNPQFLGTVPTGHMSPIASWLFIFICLGISGIRQNNATMIKYIGGGVSLTVLVASSVFLIGYLYKAPLLYGGHIIPEALPTAICFLLFSIYLLRVYEVRYWSFNLIKENAISRRLLKTMLPIVIFIVVLQGFLITNFSINHENAVLNASIILLVVVAITIVVVMRTSLKMGANLLRVETELRNSEEKYRLLADSSPEMIFLIDQDAQIKYVNSVAAEYLHLDAQNIIGKNLTEVFPPDVANAHFKRIKNVFESKNKFHTEIEEVLANEKIWIDVQLAPVLNESGEVVAVLGLSNNITERKKHDEERKLEEKRLQIQLELHKMMDAPQDQLLDFMVDALTKSSTSQFAFIGTMDKAEATLTIHAGSINVVAEYAIPSMPLQLSISEAGLLGECVRERKPVIVNAYADAPGKKGIPAGHVPIERFMAVPVFNNEKIVAVAAVANKADDYTQTDISALIHLTNMLWGIFNRRQVMEALKEKSRELESLNKHFLGRELKMIELKTEINEMLVKSGREEKYIIHSRETQ